MPRTLRNALIVLTFCLLTLTYGLCALVAGGALSLLYRQRADHPLSWLGYSWARCLKEFCTDPIGLTWDFTYCLRDLRQKGGLKIVICNHPPTMLTWAPLYVTGRLVSEQIAMVLKSSHLLNPIGWGLVGLRSGIFVSRLHELRLLRPWSGLQQKLRHWSAQWYRWQVRRLIQRASQIKGGIAIMILPDQRFKPERKARYVEKFGADIPDLEDWTVTLPPRSGGLIALLQACAGLNVTIVDMTIITKAEQAEGWTNFGPYYDSSVMVMVEDVTRELRVEARGNDLSRFAENPASLRDWLNGRFRQKNVAGAVWRTMNRKRRRQLPRR